MTKNEMMKALETKGIPFSPRDGVDAIKAIYDANINPGDLPLGDSIPVEQTAEKMYSAADVQAMLAQVMSTKGETGRPKKDPSQKEVRLSRIEGKFVVGFKDRNTDPFIKKVVHAYNKWNEQTRQFDAWVETLFDDGSAKEMPLLYLVNNATPIPCKIIETIITDTSYSIGETTQKIYKDHREDTGLIVDQVVKQDSREYDVKIPTGEILRVPSYIINIV